MAVRTFTAMHCPLAWCLSLIITIMIIIDLYGASSFLFNPPFASAIPTVTVHTHTRARAHGNARIWTLGAVVLLKSLACKCIVSVQNLT